jgi:hypothetical protein
VKGCASVRIVASYTKTSPPASLALQRFEEVRLTIQQAETRKLDDYKLHSALYAPAFIRVQVTCKRQAH